MKPASSAGSGPIEGGVGRARAYLIDGIPLFGALVAGTLLRLYMGHGFREPHGPSWLLALFVVGVLIGLTFRLNNALLAVGACGFGAMLPYFFKVARDILRNPKSHSLLGFEIVFLLFSTGVPLVLGGVVGIGVREACVRAGRKWGRD